MKKDSEKPALSTGAKTKILSLLLLALSIVSAWAKDGVVIRQLNSGRDTTVFIDTTKNGIGDITLPLGYSDSGMNEILKNILQPGVRVSYDDAARIIINGGIAYLNRDDLLSINGEDILDIFPHAADIFKAAARRRAGATTPRPQTQPQAQQPQTQPAQPQPRKLTDNEQLALDIRNIFRKSDGLPEITKEQEIERLIREEQSKKGE